MTLPSRTEQGIALEHSHMLAQNLPTSKLQCWEGTPSSGGRDHTQCQGLTRVSCMQGEGLAPHTLSDPQVLPGVTGASGDKPLEPRRSVYIRTGAGPSGRARV